MGAECLAILNPQFLECNRIHTVPLAIPLLQSFPPSLLPSPSSKVEPGKKVAAMIQVADPAFRAKLEMERDVLALLGRIDGGKLSVGGIEEREGGKEGGQAVRLIVEDGLECYLPLVDLVDAKKEKTRLGKQALKLQGEIEGLEKRVSGTAFLSKAPPELVDSTKQALAEKKEQLRTILGSMEGLEG